MGSITTQPYGWSWNCLPAHPHAYISNQQWLQRAGVVLISSWFFRCLWFFSKNLLPSTGSTTCQLPHHTWNCVPPPTHVTSSACSDVEKMVSCWVFHFSVVLQLGMIFELKSDIIHATNCMSVPWLKLTLPRTFSPLQHQSQQLLLKRT